VLDDAARILLSLLQPLSEQLPAAGLLVPKEFPHPGDIDIHKRIIGNRRFAVCRGIDASSPPAPRLRRRTRKRIGPGSRRR